jgi:cytochrome c-type biogenesis protein CcmH/NrfG
VIGAVGVIVGFILGFFLNQTLQTPQTAAPPVQGSMPENHPSPEMMAQLESLTQLVQREPENRDARVRLANTFYDMGRFDSAIPAYEEALKMDPSDVMVSTDLATSYLYVGQVDKALEQFQESLVIEPDHAQTLQNLGIAYFSTGEYQKGIEIWERLVKVHPEYPNIEDVRRQIETARMHLNQATSP